jgi:hypothetical protein
VNTHFTKDQILYSLPIIITIMGPGSCESNIYVQEVMIALVRKNPAWSSGSNTDRQDLH